ncbi:hypothetical protein QJQ45_010839 [Haematococcus lacustris]|nr:hypothetical protein QJQ45_010839 [Haematococcus lacustris]
MQRVNMFQLLLPLLAAPSNTITNVVGVAPGTYTFQLRVLDNSGGMAITNVTVVIEASNPPSSTPLHAPPPPPSPPSSPYPPSPPPPSPPSSPQQMNSYQASIELFFTTSSSIYARFTSDTSTLSAFVGDTGSAMEASLKARTGTAGISVNTTTPVLVVRRTFRSLVQATSFAVQYLITFPTSTAASNATQHVQALVQHVNTQGLSGLGVTTAGGVAAADISVAALVTTPVAVTTHGTTRYPVSSISPTKGTIVALFLPYPGTGQRLQVLLAKSRNGTLDLNLKTLTTSTYTAVNSQLTEDEKAEELINRPINALASIINDPVDQREMVGEGKEQQMLMTPTHQAAPPQAPHTDFKLVAVGQDDGFVFLLACQDFDLVAYMYSHLLMEQSAAYYNNGEPDLHSYAAVAAHTPRREGTMLKVKAGQLVLFRGNTVHAGTAGRPDSCGARLYGSGKTGQPTDNTTVNVSQLGPVFQGVFQPTQGGPITAMTTEWTTEWTDGAKIRLGTALCYPQLFMPVMRCGSVRVNIKLT